MKSGVNRLKLGKYFNQISILCIILILAILFTILNAAFITPDNLMNIVRQASVNIIMAMGVTFVMVSGEIDMSIGGVACLSGISAALMLKSGMNIALVIPLGLCIGLAVGFVNGFVVTRFKLPSMIVTLAMMNITNGTASLLTSGTAVYGLPEGFSFLGRGYVGIFPFQVVVMVVIVAAAWVILSKCLFGRYAYAIGGNETVTRLAGVKVVHFKIAYFMICSVLASLAGMILTSRLMAGQPSLAGNSMMDIMTAVVIGGAMGSGGGVVGSLLGALLLTIVANGLTINGINSFWQMIITAVILLMVIIVRKIKK